MTTTWLPRLQVVPFLLLLQLAASASASSPVSFTYVSYGNTVQRLLDLEAAYPQFVQVFSAQDTYGVPSPGTCTASDGSSTPCKQWIVRITDEASLANQGADAAALRPEVFYSGNLHGDEQVGPPTLLAMAELLASNAASPTGDPWLQHLVQTRSMFLMPISNPLGYENNVREENGVDPNRDFPFDNTASNCMRTTVARAINELWLDHAFQLAITFHGGISMIAYEWGDTQHNGANAESPDDRAQARLATGMANYAGTFDGRYQTGRMNDILYGVNGGMEDWAYAASGWDSTTPTCRPSTYGGYPTSKTDYSGEKANAVRALNILVETSDSKRPSQSTLGTDADILQVNGAGDGHVPRNIRLALQLADVVEPYAVTTDSSVVFNSRSQPVVTSRIGRHLEDEDEGGDRDSDDGHDDEPDHEHEEDTKTEETSPKPSDGSNLLQSAGKWLWSILPGSLLGRTLRATPPSGSIAPRAMRGAARKLAPATTFKDEYNHWLDASAEGWSVTATVGWDVAGSYTVDQTRFLVGRWPSDVSPNEIFAPASASDHPDVAAWKAYMTGRDSSAIASKLLTSSAVKTGTTRWRDATPSYEFSSRFSGSVALSQPSTVAANGDSDYTRVDSFIIVPMAQVDSDWSNQVSPSPAKAPQSHIVQARTNPLYDASNAGHRVLGRAYVVGDPTFVAVGVRADGSGGGGGGGGGGDGTTTVTLTGEYNGYVFSRVVTIATETPL